jgi:multisubunit Na+/H+ antiporter MnhB subunit
MSRRDAVGVIFFAIVAVFLIIGALKMHPFGDLSDVNTEMDDYIIGGENETTGEPYGAQEETGASNTVTSVVFDYRGFDTLGEATVLFTAVAGVILVFRRLKK